MEFDLGSYSRQISTSEPKTQAAFDLGLNWTYGFNHQAAGHCFLDALKYDPNCAIAHWGIAYSAGPFYNMPWREFSDAELSECVEWTYFHAQRALELSHHASPEEQALIKAVQKRVQVPQVPTHEVLDQWDIDYANAMREVAQEFPDDDDICAIYIEALMNKTPWRLWHRRTGNPGQNSDVLEALEACETAIERRKKNGLMPHPSLMHLHIHLLEMSPNPERALPSAYELFGLCPDAGHLNHMPAHIFSHCGRYDEAVRVSKYALECDEKYVSYAGPYGFSAWERCHDLHMMVHAASMMGRYKEAMEAAKALRVALTPDVLQQETKPFLVSALDGYFGIDIHVLVRFGKWAELCDYPFDFCPELYSVSTLFAHYGKALAFATQKDFRTASKHMSEFERGVADLDRTRSIHNNPIDKVMAVAQTMMEGEVLYHSGAYEEGFARLRQAIELQDALRYSEPPAWMHPIRHALGALLLEQNQPEEAHALYIADLGLDGSLPRADQNRNNIWALHGLVEASRQLGKPDQDAEEALRQAQKLADFQLTSSCGCRFQIEA